MDPKQARTRLLDLRDLLDARHHRIEKHLSRRDEPLPADSEERATELGNHETMAHLDGSARAELEQIDRALARLDAGDYGRCERCQQPIATERLDLIPYATECVACAGRAG
ncbi:MAG: TraR/DksA C4-type zinc finger protein [Planctomycetes bacterium]|nr:TraR/DksA C4-type zinc finger protein [Planctomycetota bacterium]